MTKSIEAGKVSQATTERIRRGKLTGTVTFQDGIKIINWDDNQNTEMVSVDNVPNFAKRRTDLISSKSRGIRIR